MVDSQSSFRPALLVVDMQEDFCPPVSTDLLFLTLSSAFAYNEHSLLQYCFISSSTCGIMAGYIFHMSNPKNLLSGVVSHHTCSHKLTLTSHAHDS